MMMHMTQNVRRLLAGVALAIATMTAPALAFADGYGSYNPHSDYCPSCTPSYQSNSGYRGGGSGGGGTRSYNAYYRDGGSGYGWLSGQFSGGGNTGNGYNGLDDSINTPHRGDWYAKLQAQRDWDNAQYIKAQRQDASNVRCGLSNAPAYCYRLMGPYPTVMRVVRY